MFSGIEAASVAWGPLGWVPVAFCEIEKFPSAVLAQHYPDVPNLGDITKADFDAIGHVDVAVFGSPCQSFSVAGKRLGLDDPRGNLALLAGTVVYRKRPDWFVFENVPGLLSSDSGWDFGTLLAAYAGYPPGSVFSPPEGGWKNSGTVREADGGYGLAWRVLDAQYVRVDGFGRAVPQRRRRVFVVGNSRDWRRAAAVLFERESLSGNPPPRRQAGKGVAPTISARPSGGGGLGTDFDCDGGLIPSTGDGSHCLNAGGMGRLDYETETMIAHSLRGEGFDASEDGTGRGTPLVPVSFSGQMSTPMWDFDLSQTLQAKNPQAVAQPIAFSCKDSGGDASNEVSPTLRAGGFTNSHANAGVMPAIAYGIRSDASRDGEAKTPSADAEGRVRLRNPGMGVYDGLAPTIDAGQPHSVAFDMRGREGGAQFEGPHDTANIRAASGGSSRSYVLGSRHASPSEADAGTLLQRVRESLGAEAFAEWGLGILDTLQSPHILRSALHGGELRPAAFSRRWVVYCSLSREEDQAEGAMQSMQEAQREGCSSQGRQPPQQFARELGAYLSKLSQPGAQAERFVLDMWSASEGLGPLRQTLSAVQEARRPACGEDKPAPPAWAVRRLTPEECEFLQGFPRNYTNVPWRGKNGAPDGPRYKALGNSMAVNVMRWIGRRIQFVSEVSRSAPKTD